MMRLLGNSKRLCDGTTRRDLLQIGGLGAFGLALHNIPDRTQAKAATADVGPKFGQAKSCILIYKYGSPSQHETFDPKPQAPIEIQGEMKAIPTNVSGVHIGDHLPKIAQIMDRLTVVRSLTHPYPLHGTVYATTGIPDVDTRIESQAAAWDAAMSWGVPTNTQAMWKRIRCRPKMCLRPRSICWASTLKARSPIPKAARFRSLAPGNFVRNCSVKGDCPKSRMGVYQLHDFQTASTGIKPGRIAKSGDCPVQFHAGRLHVTLLRR